MSTNKKAVTEPQHSRLREYKRWLRVSFYTTFLLVGQGTATVLGRFYFEKGGKSKWLASILPSVGFPILIPLLFYATKSTNNDSSKSKPRLSIVSSCYLMLGLMCVMTDFMYAYGLQYLPLSTFSLICASQLGFNSVFTFFLNSQKFTALIFNSVVILTISVSLLTINTESEDTKNNVPKEKQINGFFCTLAASAAFSLFNCLEQLCFEKVMKTEILPAVLSMNLYPLIVATCSGMVGLFASGDWKNLTMEMNEFKNGKVSYVMTLVWTAVTWQIAGIGMTGLIFEVSPLFSVIISNLELTIAPILAVIVFHDKIHGVKVIAFLLAVWGFLSYMYQHYLNDRETKKDKNYDLEASKGEVEI